MLFKFAMLWSCIFDRSKLQGFVGEVDFLQWGSEIVWWTKSVCLVGQVNTGFTVVWIKILEFLLFTLLLLFNSLWTNSITDNSHIIKRTKPPRVFRISYFWTTFHFHHYLRAWNRLSWSVLGNKQYVISFSGFLEISLRGNIGLFILNRIKVNGK